MKLYGHPDRVPEILTAYLPALLDGWAKAPEWWFVRYSDPDPHLRLRFRLSDPIAFSDVARRIGAWATGLRQDGLVGRVQWDTYLPEIGRYGTGAAMEAAEGVFTADSAAAVAQMALPVPRRLRLTVTAASFVDLASSFAGGPEPGARWLVGHLKRAAAPDRDLQLETNRLGNPDSGFAGLLGIPGGERVLAAWSKRRTALDRYREALAWSGEIEAESVLASLLHMHHIRAAGIDTDGEEVCRRLARSSVHSWLARRQGAER